MLQWMCSGFDDSSARHCELRNVAMQARSTVAYSLIEAPSILAGTCHPMRLERSLFPCSDGYRTVRHAVSNPNDTDRIGQTDRSGCVYRRDHLLCRAPTARLNLRLLHCLQMRQISEYHIVVNLLYQCRESRFEQPLFPSHPLQWADIGSLYAPYREPDAGQFPPPKQSPAPCKLWFRCLGPQRDQTPFPRKPSASLLPFWSCGRTAPDTGQDSKSEPLDASFRLAARSGRRAAAETACSRLAPCWSDCTASGPAKPSTFCMELHGTAQRSGDGFRAQFILL